MGGHSLLIFSRSTFLLRLLNALCASTNSRHSLFPLRNFSLQHVLLLLCQIPVQHMYVVSDPAARMMSSFSSPVIVLPMIRRKHLPTPTGIMPSSFSLVEQACMRGGLICDRVEWCPSRDSWQRWKFRQLAFVNGCHMISNKLFLSKFPCQSLLVPKILMSFLYWMRFHLELCFQR